MASVISGITLFREKSTVHRFGFGGNHADDDAVLAVRSNRVTLPLKSGEITEQVVVRGQNVPATLRLTALVIEQFNRNPTIFVNESKLILIVNGFLCLVSELIVSEPVTFYFKMLCFANLVQSLT